MQNLCANFVQKGNAVFSFSRLIIRNADSATFLKPDITLKGCAVGPSNQCCGSGSGLFWSLGSGSGKITDSDP